MSTRICKSDIIRISPFHPVEYYDSERLKCPLKLGRTFSLIIVIGRVEVSFRVDALSVHFIFLK